MSTVITNTLNAEISTQEWKELFRKTTSPDNELFETILKKAKSLNHESFAAKIKLVIADQFSDLYSDYSRACGLCEEILNEFNEIDALSKGKLLKRIGLYSCLSGDLHKAETKFQDAISALLSVKEMNNEICNELAEVYYNLSLCGNNLDERIGNSSKAIDIFLQLNNHTGIAKCHTAIGNALLDNELFSEALPQYFLSLEYYTMTHTPAPSSTLALNYNRIACCYNHIGKPERAEIYLSKIGF